MKTEEKFLLGALLGGAIGAASALILAPMSGKSFRNKLVKSISGDLREVKKKVPHNALTSKTLRRSKVMKAKAYHAEHEPVKRTRAKRKPAG